MHRDAAVGAVGDELSARRRDSARQALLDATLREGGQREPLLAAAFAVEHELAARSEAGEHDGRVATAGFLHGRRGRSGIAVSPDPVDNRDGGQNSHRRRRQYSELGYPATPAAVAASFSPKRARGDELADPRLADDLAALDDHVPAQEHGLDVAHDLGSLVEVVVGPATAGRQR